jgi:hypothetical protein
MAIPLRPTQGDEKRLLSSNRPPGKRRPSLCHPGRTRISYYAAPEMATCAAFIEESRMKFADPTKLDRKSRAAEGSAVPRTLLGNGFRQSGHWDRRSESSDTESSAISRPESQRPVWLTFSWNSRRRNPGLT